MMKHKYLKKRTSRLNEGYAVGFNHIFRVGCGDVNLHMYTKFKCQKQFKYDIQTGILHSLPQLRSYRYHKPCVFVLHQRLYVVGGTNTSFDGSESCVSYMDSITITADNRRWEGSVSLPHGVAWTSCLTLENTKVILVGGQTGKKNQSSSVSSVYMWKPGQHIWTTLAPLKHKRIKHCTVTDGVKYIYALGGYDAGPLSSLERYNIQENKWEQMLSMPKALKQHECLYVNGQILVVGGYSAEGGHKMAGSGKDPIYLYNVETDSWTTSKEPLPYRIHNGFILSLMI